MKYKFTYLGQSVLKLEVPLDIFSALNQIYEKNFHKLYKANKQLVGKIENEHSLFYNGVDSDKMKKHSMLPKNILNWFSAAYKFYLDFNKVTDYQIKLTSIWVNEMKDNEYNPIHVHQGDLFTGLSSVMILTLPSHYGKEYSSEQSPLNGALQIMGNASGQFANVDYTPNVKVRDFYIFPYDIRHCVYPFNSTNQTRRTLAANCDVKYDPIKHRGTND
jgi:hypothetical protein|tara:strand:+ start:233 stop:886 length:654 start_codon:yes stop_codon:yes gene_type:complete